LRLKPRGDTTQLLGVYTRWFNDWALLIGWAARIATGMAVAVNLSSTYPLTLVGYTFPGYIALYTAILYLVLSNCVDANIPEHGCSAATGRPNGGN
jgi:hypothetical protein